jgi:hypothetical protein
MSNRRCLISLFFLTLACKVAAQDAIVQIRVYDDAGLSAGAQRQFVTRLEGILTRAGVSAQVSLCGNTVPTACQADASGSRLLLIRVVAGQAKKRSNAQKSPLGQSIVDSKGGDCASVFVAAVQDRADEANVPWVTVLAYAAAHEIGHLLLGSGAHTPIGLMKGTWDRNDFLAMNQGYCQFTREQIRQLASHYGIDHQSQGQRREVARSCY